MLKTQNVGCICEDLPPLLNVAVEYLKLLWKQKI